jgi:hypothetical protein
MTRDLSDSGSPAFTHHRSKSVGFNRLRARAQFLAVSRLPSLRRNQGDAVNITAAFAGKLHDSLALGLASALPAPNILPRRIFRFPIGRLCRRSPFCSL